MNWLTPPPTKEVPVDLTTLTAQEIAAGRDQQAGAALRIAAARRLVALKIVTAQYVKSEPDGRVVFRHPGSGVHLVVYRNGNVLER